MSEQRDTMTFVCPTKDIVCGENPQRWCDTCPRRATHSYQAGDLPKEKRAFTVGVTGCKNCHLSDLEQEVCLHGVIFTEHQNRRASQRFSENFKSITPTCPMWNEARPFIGESK